MAWPLRTDLQDGSVWAISDYLGPNGVTGDPVLRGHVTLGKAGLPFTWAISCAAGCSFGVSGGYTRFAGITTIDMPSGGSVLMPSDTFNQITGSLTLTGASPGVFRMEQGQFSGTIISAVPVTVRLLAVQFSGTVNVAAGGLTEFTEWTPGVGSTIAANSQVLGAQALNIRNSATLTGPLVIASTGAVSTLSATTPLFGLKMCVLTGHRAVLRCAMRCVCGVCAVCAAGWTSGTVTFNCGLGNITLPNLSGGFTGTLSLTGASTSAMLSIGGSTTLTAAATVVTTGPFPAFSTLSYVNTLFSIVANGVGVIPWWTVNSALTITGSGLHVIPPYLTYRGTSFTSTCASGCSFGVYTTNAGTLAVANTGLVTFGANYTSTSGSSATFGAGGVTFGTSGTFRAPVISSGGMTVGGGLFSTSTFTISGGDFTVQPGNNVWIGATGPVMELTGTGQTATWTGGALLYSDAAFRSGGANSVFRFISTAQFPLNLVGHSRINAGGTIELHNVDMYSGTGLGITRFGPGLVPNAANGPIAVNIRGTVRVGADTRSAFHTTGFSGAVVTVRTFAGGGLTSQTASTARVEFNQYTTLAADANITGACRVNVMGSNVTFTGPQTQLIFTGGWRTDRTRTHSTAQRSLITLTDYHVLSLCAMSVAVVFVLFRERHGRGRSYDVRHDRRRYRSALICGLDGRCHAEGRQRPYAHCAERRNHSPAKGRGIDRCAE
jgi:hypothetical protein